MLGLALGLSQFNIYKSYFDISWGSLQVSPWIPEENDVSQCGWTMVNAPEYSFTWLLDLLFSRNHIGMYSNTSDLK